MNAAKTDRQYSAYYNACKRLNLDVEKLRPYNFRTYTLKKYLDTEILFRISNSDREFLAVLSQLLVIDVHNVTKHFFNTISLSSHKIRRINKLANCGIIKLIMVEVGQG